MLVHSPEIFLSRLVWLFERDSFEINTENITTQTVFINFFVFILINILIPLAVYFATQPMGNVTGYTTSEKFRVI